MVRLGLCCLFAAEPIRFRRATATALGRLTPAARRRRLAELCDANASALLLAYRTCIASGIGCFRINSQILPLKTHPACGYQLAELPDGAAIIERFRACGRLARAHGLRATLHPDQFIILNAERDEIVQASLRELEYQAEVAGWTGADVLNIHAGGVYGDKPAALARLRRNLRRLPPAVRRRLTLENDDRSYTPADLLPLCRETGLPLCYDVHHHRCLPDGGSVEETTPLAIATWDREPLFHLSSPLHGWHGGDPRPHHDLIDPADFPACWRDLTITIEIEAKAKELAIRALFHQLKASGRVDSRHPKA